MQQHFSSQIAALPFRSLWSSRPPDPVHSSWSFVLGLSLVCFSYLCLSLLDTAISYRHSFELSLVLFSIVSFDFNWHYQDKDKNKFICIDRKHLNQKPFFGFFTNSVHCFCIRFLSSTVTVDVICNVWSESFASTIDAGEQAHFTKAARRKGFFEVVKN